jgi:hypothetical protein
MVKTVKFSQFLPGGNLASGDYVVGLNGPPGVGTNTIWQFTGSGSGGSVTQTFPQQSPMVAKGAWLRVSSAGASLYVDGQADTAADGEIVGICIDSNALTFTLQQAGYITSAQAVVSGLTRNTVYFLDTATLGTMVPVDATVNNQVSRPVFLADSPTSGWVYPYRPLLVGGASPGGGGDIDVDSNIVTVNENGHGFNVGDWLRVATPPDTVLMQPKYARADNSTLQNSQSVGVVISKTANQFVLQFSGINTGAVTVDDIGNPVVPFVVYYLSNVAGKITSIAPTGTAISKPLYVCEQTGLGPLSTGIYRGYVLPQRPLNSFVSNPQASPYIFLGNLTNTSPNGPFADANILTNNGGPFRSYLMIFNLNVSGGGHGLSAVGVNPISIGFQFAAGGVFYTGTGYQGQVYGISNRAGLNTATFFGYDDDTSSGVNYAVMFPNVAPELGTRVAINAGSFTLIDNLPGSAMEIIGNGYFTDWSVGNAPSNHNYTLTINSAGTNGGALGTATSGLRLFFSGNGAIFDGTSGYFSIWGIPNS